MAQKNNVSKESAADRLLKKYIEWIAKAVYDNYGLGPATKPNWIESFPHSVQLESFVISQTKVWLHTLDSRDSNSTNPSFLKALVNRIAVYLSDYAVKAPNTTKNRATNALKSALWDKNSYIQGLLCWHHQKRSNSQKRSPQTVAKRRQHERMAQARKDYDTHRQVHLIFVEVSQYKIKR